ncbi:hypothetical protein HL658_03920 [Azospirillum sp. RWY-5-1]|uniref:Uncharacterized protein n=1 Tax=Azospirillum oleiclasticum TaxID=2735135 RepID=A0ABX2T6E1_9PROT|nr:hypothetical protein [Azospirillum oleiclasticum]NYZ11685.1 hypothetical protein [Azospirillum oleiclasticum]NYZ18846.1 hypothetical protein [Azospirillum oleiclasticum]
MYRIVNLGRTGVYVAIQAGTLATLGGRSHWESAEQVRGALAAARLAAVDRVLNTRP